MYRKYTATITIALIAIVLLEINAISGLKPIYADKTPKIDFLITVRNIEHKEVLVGLTIDGITKNLTIDGNPKLIDAPTAQIVKFSFPRENSSSQTQTPVILKLGDEYIPCISFKGSETSCLSGKIDSLTAPQAKNLDVKYIPT